jgi:hypothetical protein
MVDDEERETAVYSGGAGRIYNILHLLPDRTDKGSLTHCEGVNEHLKDNVGSKKPDKFIIAEQKTRTKPITVYH